MGHRPSPWVLTVSTTNLQMSCIKEIPLSKQKTPLEYYAYSATMVPSTYFR